MQSTGAYRYPAAAIFCVMSGIVLVLGGLLWKSKGLSIPEGFSLLLALEGTVMWACSLTPVGLLPPPVGIWRKLRWLFRGQAGTPLSLNQPLFYIGIMFVLGSILLAVKATNPKDTKATIAVAVGARMKDVQHLLGKPDSVEKIEGEFSGGFEIPMVVRWIYERYPINTSDQDFGKAGYLEFVPERYLQRPLKQSEPEERPGFLENSKIVGDAEDSFRAISFRGSFPVMPGEWIRDPRDSLKIPVKFTKDRG